MPNNHEGMLSLEIEPDCLLVGSMETITREFLTRVVGNLPRRVIRKVTRRLKKYFSTNGKRKIVITLGDFSEGLVKIAHELGLYRRYEEISFAE